ncbi:MAG: hypothetical protein ACI4DV_05010 [Lachnospiraceae bacterium]
MKKIAKGNYGYTLSHRKFQGLKTLSFALAALAVFLLGLLVTKSYQNLLTVVAMVGALPTAKELIGFIMSFQRKPVSEEVYLKVKDTAKDLETIYELNFTTYEKNYPVEAVVVCGREVVGYTADKACDTKTLEKHLAKLLNANDYKENVKIFKDLKPFLDRVRDLERKEKEDIPYQPHPRYPDLNRDQLVKHTLLALSV